MTKRPFFQGAAIWFIAAVLPVAGLSAFADEPLPVADDPPPGAKATEPAATDPAKKKPDPKADDQLIRTLNPAAGEANPEIERLERAIDGMRQAFRRMEKDDAGADTLELQRRVVADLEKLLELLKNRRNNASNPPPSDQTSSDQTSQNQPRKSRSRLTRRELDPQNSGKRTETAASRREQNARRNEREKAREAQERRDPAKAARDAEEHRRQMIKDVWGHLPPHLREAIGKTFNEKYLPKYEDLVKRYYEILAEKNRKRTDK
jgi:hypothetical protein